MKIIDLHADIGMDVLKKHQEHIKDVLTTYHLEKLKAGDVFGVNMACFFSGDETLDVAYDMVEALHGEIVTHHDVHLVLDGKLRNDKLNALMSIEGMGFIEADATDFLKWAYEKGVRIGSLCWNDSNALATGISGDPARGLTAFGKRAIQTMNELNMVVDVSHTNEKSFYNILETSKKPIIATHSNARALCHVDRNLTDQQIKAIAQNQGLIGLNAVRKFISNDEAQQNALTLAQHAQYMANLVGYQYLCIGFDFMDFLEPPYGRKAMASDLQDASMSQNFIKALETVGFTKTQIVAIAYQNVIDFFENL